jgi:hypothetical protein
VGVNILELNKAIILNKIVLEKRVVTHYGDDLDNKASIEALRREANLDLLDVERVPAGQIKIGALNIDTGGHKGSYIDGDTIVIDGDPARGIKSTVHQLYLLGFYIPGQILKFADCEQGDILDARNGINLARYLSGEKLFAFAEANLLDKSLTDEQLENFGLIEAYRKQQEIIEKGVEAIKKYRIGDAVIATEKILGGAFIAYALGCKYYVSITPHEKGGITFAITSAPDQKLPDKVLKWGYELREKHKIDEKTSGVYVDPRENMIIAGGAKNPDFKIEMTIEEAISKIMKLLK